MLPFARIHWRRPRHPLLRVLAGAAALALLAFFSVFALLVGAVVLLGFALRQALQPARQRGAPTRGQPPAGVIEGEFTVVRKPRSTLSPR